MVIFFKMLKGKNSLELYNQQKYFSRAKTKQIYFQRLRVTHSKTLSVRVIKKNIDLQKEGVKFSY